MAQKHCLTQHSRQIHLTYNALVRGWGGLGSKEGVSSSDWNTFVLIIPYLSSPLLLPSPKPRRDHITASLLSLSLQPFPQRSMLLIFTPSWSPLPPTLNASDTHPSPSPSRSPLLPNALKTVRPPLFLTTHSPIKSFLLFLFWS